VGWGDATKKADPSEVYVVDVANGTVAATLKATGMIHAVAFSPDGKWLAVATRQYVPQGATPPVLIVFNVPGFIEKFSTKSKLGDGFLDLAWGDQGKVLCAIDTPDAGGAGKSQVRRWSVLAFVERPAITTPQTRRYEALTVSPDGSTLAVADVGQGASGRTQVIRLFDLAKGTERASSKAAPSGSSPPRLGFTQDSKAVGVFRGESGELSWVDAATGNPAQPVPARFAAQPAGLSGTRSVVSSDGRRRAEGFKRNRDFGDIGGAWDGREKEFGTFIRLTENATAKTQTWRLGQGETPALAFSPDGTKLAGTVSQASGESLVIWPVPQ
jgi:WD40 repeat protein